ncbi:hypothetical protein [Sphingomonas sp. VNH70]|uniref:hypothetical protein n=1 Tax=Sphingomonas silueang TaxID=3156617 RepID=UPI0032B61879
MTAAPFSRALPILFALLQIATPTLPFLGIGRPIGEQSDAVRTLVTPAGWAFSIWGVLYFGSLVFAVVQALPARRDDPLFAPLRLPAAGAFLGNALWAAYTQVYGLALPSVVIILFTLACLLSCYRGFAHRPHPFTPVQRWGAMVPLSALASWLTVASIVNIAATLRFYGVDGGSITPGIAAGVLIVGGLIAAVAIVRGNGNLPYAVVFLWALSAIYAAGGQQAGAVAFAVALAAALVISAVALALLRRAEARGTPALR